MKYKVYLLILVVVLSCVYCFGKIIHFDHGQFSMLANNSIEDEVSSKNNDYELAEVLINKVLSSQEGDYVAIYSSYTLNALDRDSSYSTEVFAKVLEDDVAVDVGDLVIGNVTISADNNNLYHYTYPLAEGKALFGDSVEVEIAEPSVAQRRSTRVKMVVPKELFPSSMALPKHTVDRTSGYSLNWAPDANNQFGEVQIQLSYCKGISKYYNAGMPNTIAELVYQVTDDGHFTIPQADLARFPEGSYVTFSISRAWLNDISGKIAYVTLTKASTAPLLVVEPIQEIPNFAVDGMEFSSNGFGNGSILCTHEYDFDDYANTFAVDLNSPLNGPVDLEYKIYSSSNGSLVHHSTIPNFTENNHYTLPPSLPPGFYSISIKIPGYPFIDEEWYEAVFEYADCNSTSSFRLSSFPNPASNELYIKIENKGTNELARRSPKVFDVVLFDFSQKKILRKWSIANEKNLHTLDVSGIKGGQYILVVRNQKERQATQIIIK